MLLWPPISLPRYTGIILGRISKGRTTIFPWQRQMVMLPHLEYFFHEFHHFILGQRSQQIFLICHVTSFFYYNGICLMPTVRSDKDLSLFRAESPEVLYFKTRDSHEELCYGVRGLTVLGYEVSIIVISED